MFVDLTYHDVARVAEVLLRFGGQNNHEGTQLARRYGHQATEDEDSVPVAGDQQLPLYPHVFPKDGLAMGSVSLVEHLVEALEAQYLELASEAEQDADEQEHPGAVHPGGERGDEGDGVPGDAGRRGGERDGDGDGGEEEDLVRELDGEGGEEDIDEVAERAVELAGVAVADESGVVAEGPVEEEELAEAVAAEEGGEGEEGDDGEAGSGDLDEFVERDGGGR